MKTIRLQITEELHGRLKALCNHHGRQAHLLRRGVRLVCEEEERKLGMTYPTTHRKGLSTSTTQQIVDLGSGIL